MLIIYTLIAALVLFIIALIALAMKVYRENRKNLKNISCDKDKIFKETLLELDDLSERDLGLLFGERPFIEYHAGCN